MGKPRKYGAHVYNKGERGEVTHKREELVGEYFGRVDKKGSLYVDVHLAGYDTVTYVYKKKKGEEVANNK